MLGLLPSVRVLLEHGADPTARSTHHDGAMTPLHYAAKNHRVNTLAHLLEVSPTLVHDRVLHGHCTGLTALGLARRQGHPESDGHAHMLPHTKARRAAAIDVLLKAVRAVGETGDELHHGTADPPSEHHPDEESGDAQQEQV